jgi:hypothetical protein
MMSAATVSGMFSTAVSDLPQTNEPTPFTTAKLKANIANAKSPTEAECDWLKVIKRPTKKLTPALRAMTIRIPLVFHIHEA